MKKKTAMILLTAALWALLAGCGIKTEATAPDPAPQGETEGYAQDGAQTGPADAAEPDPAPGPEEETQSVQPAEPALPDPEGEAGSIADSYVGTWRDDARGTSGGRCFMEIACEDGENYSINVWWGNSAAETTHWQYTGTYDEAWEGIDYIGTRYKETTQADGTVEQTAELEEATGLLYLEDGVLLWEDTFEHTGDGMKFQKES